MRFTRGLGISAASLAMKSERERAREIMGSQFDIKLFHHVVLGSGIRPLLEVRTDVRNWSQRETIP